MVAKSKADFAKFEEREFVVIDGIRLQSLTELERSNLEGEWSDRYGKNKKVDLVMRRELIVRSIVDESGARIFDDSDISVIARWNGKITSKLYKACRDISGFDEGKEDEDEKNSD